ncbi:MFS transporter [Parvularcula marina]|uniref:MFS transporter n=1 Tax=Parvularcula marina TaxID=2292771 RepID=UPI0035169E1B
MTDASRIEGKSPTNIRGLIAAITAIGVAAVGFGHTLPLFSILLERYDASDRLIGLNTATMALAAILATPFFPKIIGRVGIKPFILACLAIMVAIYGLIGLAGERVWLWFPLRFVFGFAGAGLFVGSEIWINALAPEGARGRIIGIYSTCLALGFAMGPFMVEIFGTTGFTPFLVGMLIFASAVLPIAIASPPPASPKGHVTGFFSLIAKAPATFASSSVFAGAEAAILTFLPIYALESGWAEETGTRAITVYGLGLVALQYLIGREADRFGYGRSLFACAFVSLVGAGLFAVIDESLILLYVVLFFWGGAIAGLYTIGLTLLADRFPKTEVEAANTGFVFMYGLGAIIGPAGAGFARDLGGQFGLELFLIAVMILYVLLVARRWRQELP